MPSLGIFISTSFNCTLKPVLGVSYISNGFVGIVFESLDYEEITIIISVPIFCTVIDIDSWSIVNKPPYSGIVCIFIILHLISFDCRHKRFGWMGEIKFCLNTLFSCQLHFRILLCVYHLRKFCEKNLQHFNS